jgi:hypothetical protein
MYAYRVRQYESGTRRGHIIDHIIIIIIAPGVLPRLTISPLGSLKHALMLICSDRGGERCGLTPHMGSTKEILELAYDDSCWYHEKRRASLESRRHCAPFPFVPPDSFSPLSLLRRPSG